MKHFLMSTLIVLSIQLFGCASTPLISSQEPNSLIPLEVGNAWLFTELGNNEIHKISVIKKAKADGNTWYLYDEFGDKFWLRNHGGYQYEVVDAFDKELPASSVREEIVFYPPNKSPNKYRSSGGDITYHKCIEPITVPAGTFACHIYRVDLGLGSYSVNYYAIGVGLIRNEYATENGTKIYELSSYNIK